MLFGAMTSESSPSGVFVMKSVSIIGNSSTIFVRSVHHIQKQHIDVLN